jgi:two-component system, OmpR family, KDP operon response regulator KdpE
MWSKKRKGEPMRPSVLAVVSDSQAATLLTSALARAYEVQTASDAESALTQLRGRNPTVIITDLDIPIVDGIELCRRVRLLSAVPIIVVAPEVDGRSEVAALDAGADDYIRRPYAVDRLLARVRAVIRRHADPPEASGLGVGAFHIDFFDRRVRVHGQPVRLTPKEFELFVFMARHPNRVLAHRTLLGAVWGESREDQSEYLRVFVGQLRKKLESDPSNPRYLVTEPWVGYRFNPTGTVQ